MPTLFQDIQTQCIQSLSEDFKKRCFFYQCKDPEIKQLYLDSFPKNSDFGRYLRGNGPVNGENVLRFFRQHVENAFFFHETGLQISELLMEYFPSIVKNGFLEYGRLIKDRSDIDKNFYDMKRFTFLDPGIEEGKIHFSFEFLMVFADLCQEYVQSEFESELQYFVGFFSQIVHIYTVSMTENTLLKKTIQTFYVESLGEKVLRTEGMFYLLYNQLNVKKPGTQELSYYLELLTGFFQNNLLTKQFQNIFSANEYIFGSVDTIFLLQARIISLVPNHQGYGVIIEKGFYEQFLKGDVSMKVFDETKYGKKYTTKHGDFYSKIQESVKKDIAKYFFETGNLDKKKVPYTKKDLASYYDYSALQKKGFMGVLNYIVQDRDDNFCYELLLSPLFQASKRFINANFHGNYGYKKFPEKSISYFQSLAEKSAGDFIEIESLIDIIFEEYSELVMYLITLQDAIHKEIGHKIPEQEYDFLLSPRELLKRIFVYLSEFGFVDIIGEEKKRDFTYYSGEGFGWDYGLSKKYKTISYFDIVAIKWNFVSELPKQESLGNIHFSANSLYLPINTFHKIIKSLAKFSKLVSLEHYIVVEFSRDTFIKAKNAENIGKKEIEEVCREVGISFPPQLSSILDSLENKEKDLTLLPEGIPVVVSQEGLFQEMLKLKMFSKHILYFDTGKRLIIFDASFRSLESLLIKRKLLFDKK